VVSLAKMVGSSSYPEVRANCLDDTQPMEAAPNGSNKQMVGYLWSGGVLPFKARAAGVKRRGGKGQHLNETQKRGGNGRHWHGRNKKRGPNKPDRDVVGARDFLTEYRSSCPSGSGEIHPPVVRLEGR
jgi:hypothetical protein